MRPVVVTEIDFALSSNMSVIYGTDVLVMGADSAAEAVRFGKQFPAKSFFLNKRR